MASTDNYKKIGIYVNNSGERIFLVASSLTELKLYKDGNIVTDGYSILGESDISGNNIYSIILNDIKYNKIIYPNTKFNLLSEKTLGTTGRKIRIGDKIIFKSAENGNKSLEIILQEVSRNLIAISAGIPHALNYGIYNKYGNYYIIEEKVNIDDFQKYVCDIRKVIVAACNIQNKNTGDLHKYINTAVSFTLTNKIDEIQKCINESKQADDINKYIEKYNAIQNIFKEKRIGGDTKLNNFGFKMGTAEFIVFDTILPSSEPYLPLDWDSWYNNERNKPERKTNWKSNDEYNKFMLLFTDPIIRLLYKGCIKYLEKSGGKRNITNRKQKNKKTRKCSRKYLR